MTRYTYERAAGAVAMGLAASALCAVAASAEDRFKAVTTFTVLADMAQNVARCLAGSAHSHGSPRRAW